MLSSTRQHNNNVFFADLERARGGRNPVPVRDREIPFAQGNFRK